MARILVIDPEVRRQHRRSSAVDPIPVARDVGACVSDGPQCESYAAGRWASAVLGIVDAPEDPRTVVSWSRYISVSCSALRNVCGMAGIPSRRSLVFARLMRALFLSRDRSCKPEDLLEIADRRTFVSLSSMAGFSSDGGLPTGMEEFLRGQVIVTDPDALQEIGRRLATMKP